MKSSKSKNFFDFLVGSWGVMDWVSKAALSVPLLALVVAFGPPQPDKLFVSFLTIVVELAVAAAVFELLRKRPATATHRRLAVAGGLVALVASIGLYTFCYLSLVEDIPPKLRVVKGAVYTQVALAYRDGVRNKKGYIPSDHEMIQSALHDHSVSIQSDPQAVVRLLWTEPSITACVVKLLSSWLLLFSTLGFVIMLFKVPNR